MTLQEISRIRLASQQISSTVCRTPNELLSLICAIQAQDYPMASWAVGVRIPGISAEDVKNSLDKGEILRTHLLRPTWHLVTADNIRWMLHLTAPRIRASLQPRNKVLGLSGPVVSKSIRIISAALAEGEHLTREELAARLEKEKIFTGNNRLSHLLLEAELEGIVCSGAAKKKIPAYALLEKRVKREKTLSRDESLSRLARGYFYSRFPATLQDFAWWSGLTMTDARNALEMISPEFHSESLESGTFLIPKSADTIRANDASACLLPAFDEFILSYRTRNVAIPSQVRSRAVSDNGIFRPTIIVDGQVAGLWKRTVKKDKVIIETELFRPVTGQEKKMIRRATLSYGKFLGKETEIHI